MKGERGRAGGLNRAKEKEVEKGREDGSRIKLDGVSQEVNTAEGRGVERSARQRNRVAKKKEYAERGKEEEGDTGMVRLRRRSQWKEDETEGMPTPPLAPMETVRQCGATIMGPLYGASSPWVVLRRTTYQASSRIHRDDRRVENHRSLT